MEKLHYHLHCKILIRGAVEKKLTKNEFADWNSHRQIKFEKQVFKLFKSDKL